MKVRDCGDEDDDDDDRPARVDWIHAGPRPHIYVAGVCVDGSNCVVLARNKRLLMGRRRIFFLFSCYLSVGIHC